MKKFVIFALIALFAGSLSMSAQLNYGIKTGVNVNHIGSETKSFNKVMKNKAGWTLGVMAEYMIPGLPIGVDASVLYERLNSEMEYDADWISSSNNAHVVVKESIGRDFLTIPVNMKWKIGLPVLSHVLKPMVLTGPEVSFRLNRKNISSLSEKGSTLAWNLGLGAVILKHLQVTVVYGIPLGKNGCGALPNELRPVDLEKISYKNHVWRFNLAVMF